MPFLQLTLSIGAEDPEPLEDALMEAGATSITLEDAEDSPVLEPAPGTTPLWPRVKLKALFDIDVARDQVLDALRIVGTDTADAQFEVIEDRAWEREWLKDFKPMRFGQRLWICPGGQLLPADSRFGNTELLEPCIITLDPGLAFGTGTHPTTALCLEWLDGHDIRGRRVIDFGCGSGILAIAAAKLGAREVIAVDIDPQALQATVDNARRNEVAERIAVSSVEEMPTASAEVVLANILAEPLKMLAPRFAELVKPGGLIVLSGILALQAREVAQQYAPWFDIAPTTLRDDWARLDGIRRS
jgi:ribosomal protein L11 methyltransferase